MEKILPVRLIDRILRSCEAHGDKTAVVDYDGQRRTSYSELLRKILAVADYLETLGIEKTEIEGEYGLPLNRKVAFAAIKLPAGADFLAAEIGAWMAGFAVIPLGEHYPQSRIDYMMTHSGAKVLVDSELYGKILSENLDTKEGQQAPSGQNVSEAYGKYPHIPTDEKDIVALYYTSGSTGNPKGVLHTFGSFYQSVESLSKRAPFIESDIYGTGAPMYFMAGRFTLDILIVGGTIHFFSDRVRMDIHNMEQYIIDNDITSMFISPSALGQYRNESPSLRMLIVASERLSGRGPNGKYRLVNMYGLTETAGGVFLFDVDRAYDNTPIGQPAEGYEAVILDENGNRVADGEEGELCLRGEITPGYFRDSERNAQLWKDGWLHTGDIAKVLPDGNWLYVNRRDWMVKINGQRVEPGEVECALRAVDGVENAVVKGFASEGGSQYLCAYYISDKDLSDRYLQTELGKTLPPYMIPSYFVRMESFPLNANGKVDRKNLASPADDTAKIERREYVAPETETEKQLCDAFANILSHDRVGVDEDFFTLGGDSIKVMKLQNLCPELPLSAKAIYAGRTARGIANALKDSVSENEGTYEKRDIYPISENQRGVYIDWEMNRDTTQYNIASVLKMKEATAEQLAAAVKEIIAAHPALNAHFVVKDGDVMQVRDDDAPVNVEVEKIDIEPDTAYFQGLVQPFDLLAGPLYRMKIIQSPSAVYLFSDIHHTIFDGFSLVEFRRELAQALKGEPVEKEQRIVFDHALDEQKMMQSPAFGEAEKYFGTLLGGIEPTRYPQSSSELADKDGFARVTLKIPAESIREFCNKGGCTQNAFFLTVLTQLLHRVTREDSVEISTIAHSRPSAEWMKTFGFFVKTFPVVSILDEAKARKTSVSAAAKELQSQIEKTQIHNCYSYTKMAERFHVRPDILYVYQGDILSGGDDSSLFTAVELLPDVAKTPLNVMVFASGEHEFEIVFTYNPALYSEADMLRLRSAFKGMALSATGCGTISALSMLCDDTQVESFHRSATAEIPYKLFYQAIENNALKHPDRKALIAKDRELTFSEMNAEANIVAHKLMRRGVKRGDRVVLLLPRRSSVFVCMFGVSKTGAAYIPCDPEYPSDRINLILNDSGAQYIITTAEHLADYPGDRTIDVDELCFSGVEQEGDDRNPNVNVSPEDLAYLIYTSGSTGRPKGVMLRHIGLMSYIYDHPANRHVHSLGELGVKAFVTITTLSFDMSLKEFAVSFNNGVTVVLADEDEVMDAGLLAKLMKRTGAEAINGTCSRLLSYLELDEFCDAISRCKTVWAGGEMYPKALLEKLQSLGVKRIYNTYGPTEITVSCNCKDLTHSTSVSVGRPLLNYVEWIVDIFDNELPQGFTGELLIGGPGVAVGYNNLPEMTAKHFADFHGTRVYRSGDLSRWTTEGDVEILGRIDSQIKLRGFRIELGEIESVISRFDGVQGAVVDVKEINGVQHLCAYYTSASEIDEDALKDFISKSLTEYMVPTAYMRIDKLPLTPNGKMNRKALPLPEVKAAAAAQGGYVEPEAGMEKDIAEAFSKVLKAEKIGANDDFFAIGGTSITAIKVVAALSMKGYSVSFKDVFSCKTPRVLAAFLRGKAAAVPAVAEEVKLSSREDEVSKYADILDANTLDAFRNGGRQELGTVLLTGATGFMGIHFLREIVENTDSKVYCILRRKGSVAPESRLRSMLFYYFDKSYEELFGSRIFVTEGDVTDAHSLEKLDVKIDTVINCAANVKHFSAGDDIEKVNVEGVRNLVEWCVKTGARLIHTSTVSIAGQSVDGYPSPETCLNERMFDFGQYLGNQYAKSKYDAEELILKAIREKGLSAKIFRVGTLSSRNADGEFQINFRSNAFMGRIRCYSVLGGVPYDMLDLPCEFSPIDAVCRAARLLAGTPKEMAVFHPCNNHTVPLGDVLECLGEIGIKVEPVEREVFDAKVKEVLADESKAQVLQPLLAYSDNSGHNMRLIPHESRFTTQILYRLGYRWPLASVDYVRRFIKAIDALGFFD